MPISRLRRRADRSSTAGCTRSVGSAIAWRSRRIALSIAAARVLRLTRRPARAVCTSLTSAARGRHAALPLASNVTGRAGALTFALRAGRSRLAAIVSTSWVSAASPAPRRTFVPPPGVSSASTGASSFGSIVSGSPAPVSVSGALRNRRAARPTASTAAREATRLVRSGTSSVPRGRRVRARASRAENALRSTSRPERGAFVEICSALGSITSSPANERRPRRSVSEATVRSTWRRSTVCASGTSREPTSPATVVSSPPSGPLRPDRSAWAIVCSPSAK